MSKKVSNPTVILRNELKIKQGERLQECRKNAHLTQEELESNLELYTNQITYIENGKRSITPIVRELSKELNVRVEYLLCEDDFKTQIDKIRHDVVDTDHLFWSYLEHIGFKLTLFNLDKNVKSKMLPQDRISNMYIGDITTPTGEKKEMNYTKFWNYKKK